MDKIKRNERLGALTKILTDTPNRIHTLSEFCELFGAAPPQLAFVSSAMSWAPPVSTAFISAAVGISFVYPRRSMSHWRTSAAEPETMGVAIEVPLSNM